jgi:hypothetical protein
MEPVDPRIDPALVPAGSRAVVFAEHQPEYAPLPSVRTPDGKVITRWTLTATERAALLAGDDIFLTIWSGGAIQPVCVTVGPCDWR